VRILCGIGCMDCKFEDFMKNSKIKKVLVVYKTTSFDEFQKKSLSRKANLSKASFENQFPHFMEAHRAHEDSLKQVLALLKKYGFKVTLRSRRSPSLRGKYDLIITVGGDGTFLRTSHTVDDEYMLGVNSAPGHSVGALCCVMAPQFESKLKQIQQGHQSYCLLNRLQITINGKVLDVLALNDVLLANHSPAGTSRYQVKVASLSEEQKSSGVWVSTAAGSTAAILAAGGQKMPLLSRRIQFLVREPYRGHKPAVKLKKGLLASGQSIEFIIEMHDACLFIDGPQGQVPLHFGDQVVISNASKPLKVIK
jgi:NAD+ kinase